MIAGIRLRKILEKAELTLEKNWNGKFTIHIFRSESKEIGNIRTEPVL